MIRVNKTDVDIQGEGFEIMAELSTAIIGFCEVVGEDAVKSVIASALAILCGQTKDNDIKEKAEIIDFLKSLKFNLADELKGKEVKHTTHTS